MLAWNCQHYQRCQLYQHCQHCQLCQHCQHRQQEIPRDLKRSQGITRDVKGSQEISRDISGNFIESQEISLDLKIFHRMLNIPRKCQNCENLQWCQECTTSASIRIHFGLVGFQITSNVFTCIQFGGSLVRCAHVQTLPCWSPWIANHEWLSESVRLVSMELLGQLKEVPVVNIIEPNVIKQYHQNFI